MRFFSTRGPRAEQGKAAPLVCENFSEALERGIASDGGLLLPETMPDFRPDMKKFERLVDSFPAVAEHLLAPFFTGDVLAPVLGELCRRAFDFPVPLKTLKEPTTSVLELFHGPTAAFKDVGARFLAECTQARFDGLAGNAHAEAKGQSPTLRRTVLVATSGDTGGAVAAAFFGRTCADVIILFPKGRISPRQERQLTGWGGNITALAVDGTFDDCQRMVKEAFAEPAFFSSRGRAALSANSINIGRILPQTVYYAQASLRYLMTHGRKAGFIVPSGNVGNATAALWAKAMGFPVREVCLAFNANRSVVDFFETGAYAPQPTIATLANAMDVGAPSNLERVRALHPLQTELLASARAFSVSDDEIRAAIRTGEVSYGEVWCPHTAAAASVRQARLTSPDWVIVATAHPAKFETIVEPLVGHPVDIPPSLAGLLTRPALCTEIPPSLAELKRNILPSPP